MFWKNVTGNAGDFIGAIQWQAKNAADEDIVYGQIYTKIQTAGHVDTDEAGLMALTVAASDGNTSAQRPGLELAGTPTTNTVNVGLGYGASSLTTIAGDLDIDGDTITSAGNLTLDTVGDISLDPHTAKDVYFKENGTERFHFHLDATPTMEVTGAFLVDCSGDITLNAGSSTGTVTCQSDHFTVTSATSAHPHVLLKNTTDDSSSSVIRFQKDRGAAAVNGDDIGIIEFIGENDAQQLTGYGKIRVEALEVDDTDEAGRMELQVAESDGTTSSLTTGLKIEGSDNTTDGEVNVTIAAGAASTTAIAGNLTVAGSKIYDFHATTFENQYSDDSGSGKILKYSPGSSSSLNGSECYYLHTNGQWIQARRDNVDNGASQLLGIGLGGDPQTVGVFMEGFIRIASTEILNVPGSGAVDGLPIYVGGTAGHLDFNPPTTSTHYVRVVGYAIDDDGGDVLMYFNPDKTWVKLA